MHADDSGAVALPVLAPVSYLRSSAFICVHLRFQYLLISIFSF